MAELSKVAEEAVKEIDSKLECSICHGTFKEPRLLPCFHTFCKSPCLEELAAQDPEGKTFTCPTCGYQVSLSESGVTELGVDFHVEHLLEQKEALEKAKSPTCENCEKSEPTCYCQQCRVFMCQECTEMHSKWKDFSVHTIANIEEVKTEITSKLTPAKTIRRCKEHDNKKLKIYCKTCSELICTDCSKEIHKDHQHELIEEVLPRHKEELASSLSPLKEMLNKVDQTLNVFDTSSDKINNNRVAAEAEIREGINKFHKILDQRKAKLVADLDVEIQQRLKELASQREKVEKTRAAMSRCLEYAESGLETGAEGGVLKMKAPVLKRIEEITAEFDQDAIQPKIKTEIELTAGGTDQEYKEFAERKTESETVVASDYFIISDRLILKPGQRSTIDVHAMNRKSENDGKNFKITAVLVHARSKEVTTCDVKQQNGRHTVTYQPANKGRHSLHIRVNSRHIQGSPYPLAVAPSSESVYESFKSLGGFTGPFDIAVNSKGHMVVIERATYCISVLTSEGEKILSFGSQGSERGQLNHPCGVTVDLNDCIYVTDTSNHRLQKYTSEGKFLQGVGGSSGKSSKHLKFNSPAGICFNQTNYLLYVCDQLNHRIIALTADLIVVRCFGEKGSKMGQFHTPTNVAFDSENNLYVTDYGNNRVQVFTAEGEFLVTFCNQANGNRLEKPYAIAIDSSDTVYVSEKDRHCVSVFTSQGKYITSFGEMGSNSGQFNGVPGLCADRDDSIIVADFSNNRLQMF